jgi:hypothetical protein
MNEYFEYMTGHAVLILRAYIKVGVFLNSRVTTLSNCSKKVNVCNPPPQTHTKHPLYQTIQRHHRSQYYLRLNYLLPTPTSIQKQSSSHHTSRSTTRYSSCFISSVQTYFIIAEMYVYSIYKRPHIKTVCYI